MRQSQKIINLYKDRSIRSIKHVISIGDEEDLNQFWHYFHSEVTNDYRLLYHFISLMYREKKVGFDHDVLIRLRSCLSMFSVSLMNYQQVAHISNLSVEFSVLLNTHQHRFKEMLPEEFALIEGFIHNIDRWANTLFIAGGADLHFMDNSLKADLDMTKMLIEPQEFSEMSIDDIFDF